MTTQSRYLALTGAVLAFIAVLLAAAGSHLVDFAKQPGARDSWQTAFVFHLVHAVALIGLAALVPTNSLRPLVWGAWSIAAGILLFSGSLYVGVLTSGAMTGFPPLGGILLMTGWLLISISFWKST